MTISMQRHAVLASVPRNESPGGLAVFHNLVSGLTALGNGQAIAYLVSGSLLGMFIGVIPGLGGAVILTIVIAFIYHISLTGVLCLFLATQAGSYFSASITSILLNTPAHPEAFAVTFDGFPMAQRGEAGRALGISASSTCLGGLIGCLVLFAAIPLMTVIGEAFHPPEYCALVIITLLLIGTIGTDAVSKSLISLGLALMISTVGTDAITGAVRYTFGSIALLGGVPLVSLFLGLFAIPQMTLVYGSASVIARQNMMGQEIAAVRPAELTKGFTRQVVQGVNDTFIHWVALIRAALIGAATGLVPGIGGFAANFLSYGVAQQSSKKREEFGTGIPEGIIAPEGSSLAKEAGGMIPLLGLGVPGGVGSALFIGALAIKDVRVGLGFTKAYPVLPYEVIWIIAFGGLVGTLAGLLAAPLLARITRVPGPALVPFIFSIGVVGAFGSQLNFTAEVELVIFALIGFALRRLRFSLAAFGVGLVLGPTLEYNLYLTHTLFPGFTFVKRPLADVLIVVAVGILVLKSLQLRRDHKKLIAAAATERPELSVAEVRRSVVGVRPYPLLSVIVSLGLLGICVPFAVYGGTQYNFTTALMPVSGASIAAAVSLWRLPTDISAYIRYRKAKRDAPPVVDDGALDPKSGLPVIKDKSWGIRGQYTREAIALCWFVALVVLCYLFGFLIGVPVFCLLYGATSTQRILPSIPKRALFTVISAAVMYGAAHEVQNIIHFTSVGHI